MIALLRMTCGGQCRHGTLRALEGAVLSELHEAWAWHPGTVFSRLFRALDPECLQRAPVRLAANRAGQLGPDMIAVDGKTLGAPSRTPRTAHRCMPSVLSPPGRAWRLTRSGQDGKSNGVTALPGITGSTVTTDAMRARRATARKTGGEPVAAGVVLIWRIGFFQVAAFAPCSVSPDPAPAPDLADSSKIRRTGRDFSIRAEVLTFRALLRPGRFGRAWVTPGCGSHAPAPAARFARTASKGGSFPAMRESHPWLLFSVKRPSG